MKKIIFILTAASLLAGCTGNNKPSDTEQDSIVVEVINDTTIYGRSTEFGMSTFSLITDDGDTLDLDRGEGKIYGNLDNEGDRFALTVCNAGTDEASVGVAINLTDVDRFTKDYGVCNGHLILSGDTVDIQDLTPKLLVAKGAKGEYRLNAK